MFLDIDLCTIEVLSLYFESICVLDTEFIYYIDVNFTTRVLVLKLYFSFVDLYITWGIFILVFITFSVDSAVFLCVFILLLFWYSGNVKVQ